MIPLSQVPKIINKKDNQATFVIEGLYPGYGTTIGNAMRRVLLSSLSGAAITYVKIKGVQHEFSTLPGVFEDVITICLNLKKLRLKLHNDETQKAVLRIRGEKEVKASDFEFPSQVELINKDLHIASLTDKKAEIEMEITIQKGIGYEPREQRDKEKLEIGQISLDAIYSPIERVSFQVENMRVGEMTNFDRLTLSIETDGTMDPEEAFNQAAQILIDHFSLFVKKEAKRIKTKKEKKEKALDAENKKAKSKETKKKSVSVNPKKKSQVKSQVKTKVKKTSVSDVAKKGRKQAKAKTEKSKKSKKK